MNLYLFYYFIENFKNKHLQPKNQNTNLKLLYAYAQTSLN